MKNIYLLILFLLCCQTIWAQQVAWEHSYGTATNKIRRCELLPDGGFALLMIDGFNVSVSRLDSAGNEIWNEPIDSGAYISSNFDCFIKPVKGGILAGMCQVGADTIPLLLVKYNWAGTELWRKRIRTGRSFNTAWDLHIRSANEYLLMASAANPGQTTAQGGGAKFIIFSIDSTANINWQKIYMNPFGANAVPRNIINFRHNGFMFCGDVALYSHHPHVIKTNEEGNLIQQQHLLDTIGIERYSVVAGNFIPLSDKSIAFTGFNFVNDFSQRYILVSKADTALNMLWTVTHAEPNTNLESSRVVQMADSTILLVAQMNFANKIILIKVSSHGQLIDTTYINTAHTTCATCLQDIFLLPDSSLIYASSNFLAKIKNVGLPMVLPPDTGTVSVAPLLSQSRLRLGDAFPNPASGFVTVPYELPKKTNSAVLELRELVTGRLIKSFTLAPESKELKVELSPLSDGLYTYSVYVDGSLAGTKKLGVIK